MELRTLAGTDLSIAPLILGGNVFGWTANEAVTFALLDAFVAAGFSAIDTADSYSRWLGGNYKGGESETIIGKWIARRGHSNDVAIITKVGMDMGQGRSLRRAYITASIEASLQRLHRDHVELYLAHFDDVNTPLEETLETLALLQAQGKVRAFGCSNYKAPRLAEALAVSRKLGLPEYRILQPLYNLYSRSGFEQELAPLCIENHIGVTPYYGLASGFLSGKYRSVDDAKKSPRGPTVVKSYLNPRGLRILGALDEVAAQRHATASQISLAWLMARPGVTAPIASASSIAQLEEILPAAHFNLTAEEVSRLNEASAE